MYDRYDHSSPETDSQGYRSRSRLASRAISSVHGNMVGLTSILNRGHHSMILVNEAVTW